MPAQITVMKEKLNMLQAEAEVDVAYHEAGHYAVTHLLIANASANFIITGLQMETSEGHIRGQVGTEFPGTLNKNQLIYQLNLKLLSIIEYSLM